MIDQPAPFEFLWGGYLGDLASTTGQQVSLGLAAIASVAIGLIAIYVALLGISVMWHRVGIGEFQERAVRCMIVIAFMSPSVFNAVIVDMVQNKLPAFSLQAAFGTAAAPSLPQQFNQISNAVENMVEAAKAQTESILSLDLGAVGLAQRLEISIVGGLIAFVLLCAFCIAMTAFVLTSLVLDLLAVTFVAYLFKRTQGIADRTVDKLIGLALVVLVSEIVIQQMLIQDRAYLITRATAVGSNVEAMIGALWKILWVFLAGLLELAFAVRLAIYIGGGVQFSAVSPILLMTRGLGRKV